MAWRLRLARPRGQRGFSSNGSAPKLIRGQALIEPRRNPGPNHPGHNHRHSDSRAPKPTSLRHPLFLPLGRLHQNLHLFPKGLSDRFRRCVRGRH